MSTIYQAHDCNARKHTGATTPGSIWQCDDCGRYWVVSWLVEYWVPLRWWHFIAKSRVAEAKRAD